MKILHVQWRCRCKQPCILLPQKDAQCALALSPLSLFKATNVYTSLSLFLFQTTTISTFIHIAQISSAGYYYVV